MKKLSSVLLVDDNDTTNFLNEPLLTKLGVAEAVLVARNGEEALRMLATACDTPATCPELVLLDLNMPMMSGIDFLEAFQPPPPAPPICVIVLTTTTHSRDLARLASLPHAGLLHKPLTRTKVDALLREHFKRHLPEPGAWGWEHEAGPAVP
ncbi:response regulator [Hymenobacter sp. PAMC 26628]|uniref:response regulator n=1 Tax=Hymenobacter sp. PAMC 26628 TaxID=1484118 RepID=UPI0009EBD853|nr:response regulator [Hymenobacter sp. PAMC 26628]